MKTIITSTMFKQYKHTCDVSCKTKQQKLYFYLHVCVCSIDAHLHFISVGNYYVYCSIFLSKSYTTFNKNLSTNLDLEQIRYFINICSIYRDPSDDFNQRFILNCSVLQYVVWFTHTYTDIRASWHWHWKWRTKKIL